VVDEPQRVVDEIRRVCDAGGVAWLLLDIGGVLFPDPWETLICTPKVGLADRLSRPELLDAAGSLWWEFSLEKRSEEDYWTALENSADCRIPLELVQEVSEELLHPFPWAENLLNIQTARVAIISDNTSFWFDIQSKALHLDRYPQFLSFERGASKLTRPIGLFEMAARETESGSTGLVIDDREHNVERALSAGLQARWFAPCPHR
jgi:FMN phosphatase YigB (HAD superfamily)